jgi:plastocyanin
MCKKVVAFGTALTVLILTASAFQGCSGCNNTDRPPAGSSGGGEAAEAEPKEQTTGSAPAPIDPATVGSIRGSVFFDGEAPVPAPITLTTECSALHAGGKAPAGEEILVNSNKTLKNVFVYIKTGLEGRKFPVPAEIVVLDQKGCMYVPHVLAARAGQSVEVRSSDPATHNVNCVGLKNKGFNRAMPGGIAPLVAKFATPELSIKFKCDIHPWMGAFLHVTSHPYFAITGDGGTFEIGNIPPGNYTIEAVHESLKTKSQTVTIGPKDAKDVEFRYQR